MKNLKMIIVLILMGGFIQSKAQTSCEVKMNQAFAQWESESPETDYKKLADTFGEIAKENPDNWIPKYYNMFMRTLSAFELSPKAAIQVSNDLEKEYEDLMTLNPNKSEALALRGLFRTLKVAKDPNTYGMTLSSGIIWDYNEALKLDPKNPRAMYLMAQFNMKAAPFWGTDPKKHCAQVEQAKQWFLEEKKAEFEPQWGVTKADEILKSECQ